MTKEQRESMEMALRVAAILGKQKYEAGQGEHGGNLWEKSPKEIYYNILEEAIDSMFYAVAGLQGLGLSIEDIIEHRNGSETIRND